MVLQGVDVGGGGGVDVVGGDVALEMYGSDHVDEKRKGK